MGVMELSAVGLIALCALFIATGIWARKLVVSTEDFLLAGRAAPFWLMSAAYLGGFVGGASVSGYCGMGYTSGIYNTWAALFVIGGCFAFVCIFSRRLNHFGRKTGAVTITDFICTRYGESLRLPAAIISFFRPAFLTGMQFLAVAVVLKVAFGMPLEYGVFVSAAVILVYMITAGQYSALLTQWQQSLLQSLGIVLFAWVVFRMFESPNVAMETMYNVLPAKMVDAWAVDTKLFSVWLITLGIFYLVDPWIYMWAFIGKTPRISSNAMLAILGCSYYNFLPFLSGMALAAAVATGMIEIPKMAADGIYAWFAMNKMGPAIGATIMVGLLMTIVSCGSSFAMNGVTILTRDIYQKCINKNATDAQSLFASRISLIIVTIIGIASALWLPILVPLWVLAQALAAAGLLGTVMAAWFWKRSTTAGALASTILGGLTAFVWAVYSWTTTGNPGSLVMGFHACHVGLAVSIPTLIIVSLLTRPEYEKAAVTNYAFLGREMSAAMPRIDPDIGPGFYGWLGAHSPGVKILWTISFALFFIHYMLAIFFKIPFVGYAMLWITVAASWGMLFILAVLGSRDVLKLVRMAKVAEGTTK